MALTYDDITSKTNRFIVPRLVDEVYKSSPVFTRMRTRNAEKFEGGRSIQHPIMYARLRGGAFSRGGTFDTTYVQTDTALEVNVKYYYVNATLYGTDNVLNRGPEAAMSYVESKLVNAAGRMAELLGTDLFLDGQGTNSPVINLDGFTASIDDGSNFATYGGITRSDIATGANVGINSYFLGSIGTMALATLQTAYGNTWFGNEHVDLIATTQPIWDILWNKIQPQQRFMEESSDVAKIGFQSLRYNGSSLVVDQYAPTGKIWGLNTKYIQFWISTLRKYQSIGLPCTATCDGKPALIDSDAVIANEAEPFGDRDRLSERASLVDDAIVGSHGKQNHESAAETTAPVRRTSNKFVGFTGWKEALKMFWVSLFSRPKLEGCLSAA